MKIVTAPEIYEPKGGDIPIFIAGGISGTKPWQSVFIDELEKCLLEGAGRGGVPMNKIVLLNPRRATFNIEDTSIEEMQIEWEWKMLRVATGVVFWFPPETVCPVALFELGKEILRKKYVRVGRDKGYTRKTDLLHQLRLERPDMDVYVEIPELAFATAQMICRNKHDLEIVGPPFDGRYPANFTGTP